MNDATLGNHYNFMSLIGGHNPPGHAQTLAHVAQINADPAVLLEDRNDQVKTLHVLNAAHEKQESSKMFLFLLPSRIAWAKTRLSGTQKQIDFNLAYCEMEINRLAGEL